jgi:surface antigen
MRRSEFKAGLEKICRLAAAVAVVAALGAGIVTGAHAAPNSNGNPYPYGKSGYWAWQNRPDLPADLGLPKDWTANAAKEGWPVSDYPRHGDIAVFQPGIYDADATEGHVAVVEQVFDDGTYASSQMDESDCRYGMSNCGDVNHRTYSIIHGTSFIHYKKDTRTTWGFASGAAGWTPFDLGAGNMGGPGWYYPLAGTDPRLVSPELEIPLDAYNAVEVDIVQGAPVADSTMQLYFATAQKPNFTEDNSIKVQGEPDGALHRYTFYFGGNPDWSGTLTHLRFDPAGPGTAGGVRIDRVRLVHTDTSGTYNLLTDDSPDRRSRP